MAGARVLDELGETDDRSRAELTALMGAVFGVVTSSFLSPSRDGDEDDVPMAPPHLEHVLTRLERGFTAP